MLALIGMIIIYKIINAFGKNTFISLVASSIYILYFAIGTDELEKPHATSAVFLLAILWLSLEISDQYIKNLSSRLIPILMLTIISTIIITPQIAFILLVYFLLFYSYQVSSKARPVKDGILVISVILISPILIFAINYGYTGIPHDQYLLAFWPYLNFNKILELGVIHNVIIEHYSLSLISAPGYGGIKSLSLDHLILILKLLRLDFLWPLFMPAPLLIRKIYKNRTQIGKTISIKFLFLFYFTLSAIVTALAAGTVNHFSTYRIFGFFYPIPIIFVSCLWSLTFSFNETRSSALPQKFLIISSILSLIPLSGLLMNHRPELKWNTQYRGNNGVGLNTILENGGNFAIGKFSIKDAYQNQLGWEGKHPSGGIYPAMYEVWKIVGPNIPILSFHIHDYCMLPNCKVIRMTTHRLGQDWSTMYTYQEGTAQQIKDKLISEGVNYFFISFDLPFHSKQHPATLFAPDIMKEELVLKWSDGKNHLLTWADKGGTKLSEQFINKFVEVYWDNRPPSKPVAASSSIYRHILKYEEDLAPFQLPWCTNCEGLAELIE